MNKLPTTRKRELSFIHNVFQSFTMCLEVLGRALCIALFLLSASSSIADVNKKEAKVSLTENTTIKASVNIQRDSVSPDAPLPGRLHIVFVPLSETEIETNNIREPRLYSAWPTKNVEPLFSIDLSDLPKNASFTSEDLNGFPYQRLEDLPAGRYAVQAVYDSNILESSINSEGNAYSSVEFISIKNRQFPNVQLKLNNVLEPDTLPDDDQLLRFVKFKSETLSQFWNSDMFLRAGVILPRSYFDNPLARYPVYFDIGGYGARYTRAQRLYDNEKFQEYWLDESTPEMVIIFLDGEAPFGDPYQINSANNGPYGDATWQEFLPYLEQQFNIVDKMEGRFVSGCSTGGWVSLALQIFYPDTFNGAWSFSADGVDFRFFQLVDIYSDQNAFFNEHDQERPSYRQKDGDVIFSIKHEIDMENTMGRGSSFITSGGQWGGWNAVYSPKGENGLPMAIWDPDTGVIDKRVAQEWKKYDLRYHLDENWLELGPKLQGKLHIWMGDMDNFYLNNAMYLFEDMLKSKTEPRSDARFTWRRGVGHCDYDGLEMRKRTISEMIEQYSQSQ